MGAVKQGQPAPDHRPIVPVEKPLPSGDTGRYKWRQSASEVEIVVPIGDAIKARDIVWKISQTHITLGVKGQEVLRNARLAFDLKLGGGHLWQIDTEAGQRCILATLEKAKTHEEWHSVEREPADQNAASASVVSCSAAA